MCIIGCIFINKWILFWNRYGFCVKNQSIYLANYYTKNITHNSPYNRKLLLFALASSNFLIFLGRRYNLIRIDFMCAYCIFIIIFMRVIALCALCMCVFAYDFIIMISIVVVLFLVFLWKRWHRKELPRWCFNTYTAQCRSVHTQDESVEYKFGHMVFSPRITHAHIL